MTTLTAESTPTIPQVPYLKYQNRRPKYSENWRNVVNWAEVERRYEVGHR